MDLEEFRKNAHQAVDWVADYFEKIESYPVKSQANPRDIFNLLPDAPPEKSEPFDKIIKDLNDKIMPGITHWQHPNFHAYFPANTSYPSILGEIITSGIAAQCMIWETSPAAAELEEKMMEWLKVLMGLPSDWHGVIQDTASTATLAAILSAREKVSKNQINKAGFNKQKLRVYCSQETHSSIDKAVKIAGIGSENLVKIKVDKDLAMDAKALELAISEDLKNGFTPCCVIGTLGTTSTLAFDPITDIAQISQKYKLWLHVDAAYAGSAFILPECRVLADGLEHVDSYVFNPHKWLMVSFDCSAYFVKSKEDLLNTFAILPEYLKTKPSSQVNDYRDWGVPLGRRFRALKLWFVLRSYGSDGLIEIIRNHNQLGVWLKKEIENHPDFELLAPQKMNVVVFRYYNKQSTETVLNRLNEQLMSRINSSGEAYLSHTKVHGKYAIRLVIGQTEVQLSHVQKVWDIIKEEVDKLKI